MADHESMNGLHESHDLFKREHDEQLVQWMNRRPDDWTLSAGGSGTIYGWGHNHRGQLGGIEGAKVKVPTPTEALATLRPVQLIGGEQTLFAVTADGKVSPNVRLHSVSFYLTLCSTTCVSIDQQWQFDDVQENAALIYFISILSCTQQDTELGADWVSEAPNRYPPPPCWSPSNTYSSGKWL